MIWLAVLAAAVGCYLLKLAGVSVPASLLERPAVQRIAMFLPVAMLAALVATGLFDAGGRLAVDFALLAGVGAAVVALVARQSFLVVILVAAATTAVLRALT
ncbi:branched-subunit amino acid transport protein AzlD [Haloactinopolyspora alba]|uniref:Branched-subunit amino acid transport protein AzlD n=1 Tax=Haloactinopolyspora alba TaxID=648780 RepID=A0A2P8DV60_9ACTN|nr:AzlD domain-containing protein [Haloactinopolyspora alba]PSL01113.1 branched-subunit amino acid transport protein AzlD [Haloactinopolyspora alba]